LIERLPTEAETAVSNRDIIEQNYYRYAVVKKIKHTSGDSKTTKSLKKNGNIMNIKNNIYINKLTITKADKGKTSVILIQENYRHKTQILYKKTT
jgi:ribosomal protein L24